MKKLYRTITVALLLIGCHYAQGQQDPLYNQYLFNQLIINPAYAGAHNILNAAVISRAQWIGLEGAPVTNTALIHSSIAGNKVGLGFMAINDRLGVNNNTEVHVSYSYKIDFGNTRLSFGIQSSIINYQYNYDELNLEFVNDASFQPVDENFTKPNFGAGLFLMSEKFYLGGSVPRILNIEVNDGVMSSTRYNQHYYFAGGVLLTVSNFVKLKPSFLLKVVESSPASLDLTGSFLFGEFVWAGVTLRNLNSIGVNTQVELSDKLRLGYSFELPTNTLITSNFGTHELMVSLDMAPFGRQILKRRYF